MRRLNLFVKLGSEPCPDSDTGDLHIEIWDIAFPCCSDNYGTLTYVCVFRRGQNSFPMVLLCNISLSFALQLVWIWLISWIIIQLWTWYNTKWSDIQHQTRKCWWLIVRNQSVVAIITSSCDHQDLSIITHIISGWKSCEQLKI